MIAKCFVVLTVVSQISAFMYTQDANSYGKSGPSSNSFEFSYPSYHTKEKYEAEQKSANDKQTSSHVGSAVTYKTPALNTSPVTRNVVVKGKYTVALQSSGPQPEKKIPIFTSHVRTPLQEKPTVRLPTKIPAPKTISHTCTCFKTIVKPRVQQTLITVPSIQRYIETLHKPVIENIHYEACPVRFADAVQTESQEQKEEVSLQNFQVQPVGVANLLPSVKISGFETPCVNTFELSKRAPVEEESGREQKSQNVEIPRFQFVEAPKIQSVQFLSAPKRQEIEIPSEQLAESQKTQTIEIPRIKFVDAKQPVELQRFQFPEPQKVELSKFQFVEMPKSKAEAQIFQSVESPKSQVEVARLQFPESQKIEVPQFQFVESPKSQVEVARLQYQEPKKIQFLEAQKSQNIEVPRVQFIEAQKSQTVEIPRLQFVESEKFQTVEIPRAAKQEAQNPEFQQQNEALTLGSGPFRYTFK